jgi:Holliday junction DNA helicase RuvB
MDQRYLQALVERFRGGPTGVDALAAALNEARDALEETVEPFLIRKGYVSRTPRGRVAEEPAYRFLGIARSRAGGQLDFGEEV